MGNYIGRQEDHKVNEVKDEEPQPAVDPEELRIQCLSFEDFSKEVNEFLDKLNLKSSECVKLYKDVTEVEDASSPVYRRLEQNFDDIQNYSSNLRLRLYYRLECGSENETENLNRFVIDLVRITNVITRNESAFLSILKRKAKELGGGEVGAGNSNSDYIPIDDTNSQMALEELRSTEAEKKKLDDDILDTLALYLDVKSLAGGNEDDQLAILEENIRTAFQNT